MSKQSHHRRASALRRAAARSAKVAFIAWAGACGSESGQTLAPPPPAPPPPAPHVASASCPLKSQAEWQQFLETTAQDETWVKTCSDHDNCGELSAFAAKIRNDVFGVLARCAQDLADNPPIAACTANLRRYAPTWLEQHASDSYGFRQDNATYFAAQTAPAVPSGMMDPPAALLSAFPERASIEKAARDNGWPYLTHDSCLGGVRIYIAVDDAEGRFDRWMLVGLDAEAKRVLSPAIMSFIAVQKKDVQGKSLVRARLHFRDYWLTEATGSWNLALPETLAGKCYACHGSGMRLLVPSRGSVTASAPVKGEPGYGDGNERPDFGLLRLVSFNQRLASYGLPDWNGTIEPADHGPLLGQALGCSGCHNGNLRGELTVSTSEGMLGQKIVEQLSMRSSRGNTIPDERAMVLLERDKTGNPPLTADEKSELEQARADHIADYQHIMAERFPIWRAWLLERRCE